MIDISDTDLAKAIRLAKQIDAGTPTPSEQTEGLDTEELSSLFQGATRRLASGSGEYTDREKRIIHERDSAITNAEQLKQELRNAIALIEEQSPVGIDDQTARNLQLWRELVGEPSNQKPRAVITLTDGDEEGEVNCSIDFIPSVRTGETGSPAQQHALEMLSSSLARAKKHTEPKFRPPRKKR